MLGEIEIRTAEGFTLAGHVWTPETETKASILLVHGLGEHGGRYHHFAEFLNSNNIAVISFDLRGHGKSEGKKGLIPKYATFLDDISRMLDYATTSFPGTPLILYGHSMGGNLVINYAHRREPGITGVVASAPLLRIENEPTLLKRLAGELMLRIYPGITMPNGISSRDLSRDPEVVKAYDEDPLVHDRVSPAFLDVRRAGLDALSRAGDSSLPILLMHGDSDRITSHEASIDFASAAGKDCTVKIWPGLFHEIHNEPEKEAVVGFVAEWIDGLLRR